MKASEALDKVTAIVGETIEEATKASMLKGIPSGHLYSALMGVMNLETYNEIIGRLVAQGKVSNKGHLLTWIGGERV